MVQKSPVTALALSAAVMALAACQGRDETRSSASQSGSTASAASSGSATQPMRQASGSADFVQRADQDQDMRKVLEQYQALGPKPIATLSAEEARRQPTPADAAKAVMAQEGVKPLPPLASKRDVTIPGPAGPIPARIYVPEGGGPMPVVVYYHVGGWVIADINTYDASAEALARKANAIVVSSHYRQGPEHKFPAAHQDAFTAYQWALQNARSFGGDPRRIAVVGESAGGNLAASVSMMARDRNVQMPVHQVLVYPIAGTDTNTPSYQENANAKPLDKAGMEWFFDKYLRGPQDMQNPMINLVEADLRRLPPTTIITAEIDPAAFRRPDAGPAPAAGERPRDVPQLRGRDARVLRHGAGRERCRRRTAIRRPPAADRVCAARRVFLRA